MVNARPEVRDPGADGSRADLARFLRIATHDLRQPIAATRTIVSVLADGHAGPLLPTQADLVARQALTSCGREPMLVVAEPRKQSILFEL